MTKKLSKKTVIISCITIVCLIVIAALIILLGLKAKQDPREAKTYNVTFYSDNNTVLKIDNVIEHHSATPPVQPEMTYGNIFVKWNEDFTNVISDLEVHPETKTVRSEKNVFALSGAYGTNDSEIVVPLQLCGDVLLSGFELKVVYHPEKLELQSVFNVDGGILLNDEEAGVVKINYVSIENTVSDVDICTFKFKIKAETGEIPIKTNIISDYANDEDNRYKIDYINVDSVVYTY